MCTAINQAVSAPHTSQLISLEKSPNTKRHSLPLGDDGSLLQVDPHRISTENQRRECDSGVHVTLGICQWSPIETPFRQWKSVHLKVPPPNVQILSLQNVFTTAYDPQTKGQVERFHGTLVSTLRHYYSPKITVTGVSTRMPSPTATNSR